MATCSSMFATPFQQLGPAEKVNPYDSKTASQDCEKWCNANNEQPVPVPVVTDGQPPYRMNTVIDKNFFISEHDSLRQMATRSGAVGVTRDTLPGMKWNQSLFCSARCSPKICSSMTAAAHDNKYAQSLAFEPYGIQQWYDEINNLQGETGHLRNLLNSSELGCHYQVCDAGTKMKSGSEMRCNYGGHANGMFPF